MVGIVLTVSSNLSLYSIVVLPAASSPGGRVLLIMGNYKENFTASATPLDKIKNNHV